MSPEMKGKLVKLAKDVLVEVAIIACKKITELAMDVKKPGYGATKELGENKS